MSRSLSMGLVRGGQASLPAVIFLTMYKEDDIFNEAMDAGAHGCVLKESAASDILSTIEIVADGQYYISPSIAGFLVNRRNQSEALARRKPGLADLTPSERQILELIADNKTSKEIADELDISVGTVENHRANIWLDLHGVRSLVKFAFDNRSRL